MASGFGSASALKYRQGKAALKQTAEEHKWEQAIHRELADIHTEADYAKKHGDMDDSGQYTEMAHREADLKMKLDAIARRKAEIAASAGIPIHERAAPAGFRSEGEARAFRAMEAERASVEMEARERTKKGSKYIPGVDESHPTFLTKFAGHCADIRREREEERSRPPPAASAPVEAAPEGFVPAKAGGAGWAGPGGKAMFDKKFTEEDASDKWEMRGAAKKTVAAPAASEGMWGRKTAAAPVAAAAPVSHRAAGVLPRELDAILRRYPVVYKPSGDKFRVEFFNKKIEALAGGRSFAQIQAVKDDVKASLIKELGAAVSLSEAPRGFVFDFTVV
jgi:hypothetical protein